MRWLLILGIFLPVFFYGQIPKPKPDTYVNDYTHSLTDDQVRQVDERIYQLEQETSVQLAILLIHQLPGGMSIEDYALQVGNTWKVGKHQNGMVYVAVLDEHIHRLEIARRLEGDIPDVIAGQIIDNLRPLLRNNDYFHALLSLVDQVRDQLLQKTSDSPSRILQLPASDSFSIDEQAPEYYDAVAERMKHERTEYEKKQARYNQYGNVAIGLIIGALVIYCIWAWRYKRNYVKRNTVNGVYLGVGSAYYASQYGDGTSGSSGASGFGGFGGSGGGGFSGGGASGRW